MLTSPHNIIKYKPRHCEYYDNVNLFFNRTSACFRIRARSDTIILNRIMKTRFLWIIALLLIALTLGFTAANFASAEAFTPSVSDGVMTQPPTPTLPLKSEIGSTDGILIMGIVIVLIITLPVVFRKR